MRQFSPVFVTSVALTAAALAMWGLAADWAVTHVQPDMRSLDGWGAITVSAVAALCWYAYAHRCADRDRSALIRTLSRTVARTVPMRRVP